jgi:hypothetical protein
MATAMNPALRIALDEMTKGELFDIIVFFMFVLLLVSFYKSPKLRKGLVDFVMSSFQIREGEKPPTGEDMFWGAMVIVVMLLILLGCGLIVARVIVEIVSGIVSVTL